MGSGKAEPKPQLIGMAERRAFETYMRFGRLRAAESNEGEHKAVNPSLALPAALPARATRFYVWRTTGDSRVRSIHAARAGQVFAWSDPPSGGHPGSELNCRCWATPYYGDPERPESGITNG